MQILASGYCAIISWFAKLHTPRCEFAKRDTEVLEWAKVREIECGYPIRRKERKEIKQRQTRRNNPQDQNQTMSKTKKRKKKKTETTISS